MVTFNTKGTLRKEVCDQIPGTFYIAIVDERPLVMRNALTLPQQ